MINRRRCMIHFPSGRKRSVVPSRYELARKLAAIEGSEWIKLSIDEVGAARSLELWGMAEMLEGAYARWSLLHERPRFLHYRRTTLVDGAVVSRISAPQYVLIQSIRSAGGRKHIETYKNRPLQISLRALERRGIVAIEDRYAGQLERNAKYWVVTTLTQQAPGAVIEGSTT